MTDLNSRVRDFFGQYETANAEFEVQKIAAVYADGFMFGGPEGVQWVKKEDFVKVLPRRKEMFRAMGLASSTLQSLEATALDPRYTLVRTVWKMRIERDGKVVESENAATYILFKAENGFQIVSQIDHQDLRKKLQELGVA